MPPTQMASTLPYPFLLFHLNRGSLACPLHSYRCCAPAWPFADSRFRNSRLWVPTTRRRLSSTSITTRAMMAANEEEEEETSVLTNVRSAFNNIMVVDTPKHRFLLLDSTHNVHSIINKDEIFTDSYWDVFATLPAIIPEGPVAILGLGAGTASHLLLDLWPSLHLEGWEIDPIVRGIPPDKLGYILPENPRMVPLKKKLIDKAREYFSLSDLEKCNDSGGFLSINIDDALSPSASFKGRFAGIIVDLFCDGDILPQLKEVDTWLEIQQRLMPSGRIMVNCGGRPDLYSGESLGVVDARHSCKSSCLQNPTVKALSEAFPGELWWKKVGPNDLAFTGPEPDFDSWSTAVHIRLRPYVKQWKGL